MRVTSAAIKPDRKGELMTDASNHTTGPDSDGSRRPSSRSTISFPYAALDEAIRVAAVIHRNHGSSCDLDQLAAGLESTTTSSTFRSLVASAKTFGLIDRRVKVVSLTELGAAVVDPLTRDEAKVRAFLEVPLYRQIHDKFAGVLLPPDAGLEAEIQALGVTTKSVAKARQTLMRSATIAGFFHMGKDRLVRPPTVRSSDPQPSEEPEVVTPEPPQSDDSTESSRGDPLLGAIWARLPSGGQFPNPERQNWLKMLELALDMVYGAVPVKEDVPEDDKDDTPF